MPLHATLLLLRRGPIDPHWDTRVLGQEDPPLADDATLAEGEVLRRLAAYRPDRIVTSDLARARATAERLAEITGAPLAVRRELRERRFGRWEGKVWADLVASDPRAVRFLDDFCRAVPPGGESLVHAGDRAVKALLAEARRVHRGTLCFLGHAGPIRALIAHVLGVDLASLQRFQVDPFSLSIVRLHGASGTLERLNQPLVR